MKITTEHASNSPVTQAFCRPLLSAVLLRISWHRGEERREFLGNRKDWKGTKQYISTLQYNIQPTMVSETPTNTQNGRTKFKSPFKKIIQTRHFSRFQSIEFYLAHERYVFWTASLSRRFANWKYRVILCLFVTHSSRHSKFSYVWKNGKDIMLEDTQRT